MDAWMTFNAAQWDERYFTLDPASLTHIMKHNTIYEKPWQSRRLIISLIGCGMLAAEGAVHKRQRRVATPAFSIQNLRAFIPLVFKKGVQLRDKFAWLIREDPKTPVSSETKNPLGDSSEMKKTEPKGTRLDVVVWISRATFDVIGLAGSTDFHLFDEDTD
jgi:cytochrome P450